jgi:hypothetical protein
MYIRSLSVLQTYYPPRVRPPSQRGGVITGADGDILYFSISWQDMLIRSCPPFYYDSTRF